MRPQTIATTGTSVSVIVPFDTYRNPFNVGIGCVVNGTATYTIQHTFDDVITQTASITWFNHDDASLVSTTTNANGNFAYPVSAARINQTAGTGTVTVTFRQSGLLEG
jgi:hypothetical protein